jgi:hypothetical protein
MIALKIIPAGKRPSRRLPICTAGGNEGVTWEYAIWGARKGENANDEAAVLVHVAGAPVASVGTPPLSVLREAGEHGWEVTVVSGNEAWTALARTRPISEFGAVPAIELGVLIGDVYV